MSRPLWLYALLCALTAACHHHHDDHTHGGVKHSHEGAHAHHGHHDDDASDSRTQWGELSQTFVEFPPLVMGTPSTFIVHLTWADTWEPVAAGDLTLVLSGGDAPEERFSTSTLSQPGIFRPEVIPSHPVLRTLSLELNSEGRQDTHELGQVRVFPSADKASVPQGEDEGAVITLLLEQQWNLDFRVERAEQRTLRSGLEIYGRVRELEKSVTLVRAPAQGRLIADDKALPAAGAVLERNAVIARLLPMVSVAERDRASLRIALDEARAKERWAKGEVKRLRALLDESAASEKSLAAAQLVASEARAATRAAKRRLARLAALQSPDGAEASALVIRAPHDGRVRGTYARAGALVQAGEPLLELVDPKGRIIELDLPEVDAAHLPKVSGALVRVTGHDAPIALSSDARINIPLQVDEVRHTIPLWWRLPPEMDETPARLAIEAQLWTDEAKPYLSLPKSALVQDAGLSVVYVQHDGENFLRRVVKTGPSDGDFIAILSGLTAGESVVVEGAYLLKLAGLKDAAPDHGHTH